MKILIELLSYNFRYSTDVWALYIFSNIMPEYWKKVYSGYFFSTCFDSKEILEIFFNIS